MAEEAAPSEGSGGTAHSNRAVIAAMLANLAIAVAKFVGFAITASSAMLAESVHSVADTGNQLLLLLGGRRAKKKATDEHPFGYGRERYFWSFVVALVLFTLGSLFAIYEAIHKLAHPEPIESPEIAIGILIFAIFAEGFSFRTAIVETRKVKGDATYRQFIRRAKIPELPIVLLEDFGALTGLAFALAAIITADTTGNPDWDAYGSLAIGVLLGIIAIILVIEMKSLLIGESASRKQREAIQAAIEIEPGVLKLIHMRTEHLGPEELLVCVKVEFDHRFLLPEVAEAIDRVERNVRANVPEARVMYIEPDVDRAHRSGPVLTPHVPTHEVPPEIRARMEAEEREARRPSLPPSN
jgi:cation diffusion facilitator family transporter